MSVLLPASGWETMAKLRRRWTCSWTAGGERDEGLASIVGGKEEKGKTFGREVEREEEEKLGWLERRGAGVAKAGRGSIGESEVGDEGGRNGKGCLRLMVQPEAD